MPVHFSMMRATSLARTCAESSGSCSSHSNSFRFSGISPYRISATRRYSPRSSSSSANLSSRESSSRAWRRRSRFSFCDLQRADSASSFCFFSSSNTWISQSRSDFSFSFLRASRSISSDRISFSSLSSDTGRLCARIFTEEVASSRRSIALSGSFRSPI